MLLKMKKPGISFEQIFTSEEEMQEKMLTLHEMGFTIDESDSTTIPVRREVTDVNKDVH